MDSLGVETRVCPLTAGRQGRVGIEVVDCLSAWNGGLHWRIRVQLFNGWKRS